MIKFIIFDYDGVIADSFPGVHAVFRIICKELGKECPATIGEFRKVFGENATEFFNRQGFTEEERIKAYKIFKTEISKQDVRAYQGISGVLHSLSEKYKLVLVSSTYKNEITKKLEEFGLSSLFADVFGRENDGAGRLEKTALFEEILRREGLKHSEVILIGDRTVDYKEGRAAGLENIILVKYGWGPIPSDYRPEVEVNKPSDLLKAVGAMDR